MPDSEDDERKAVRLESEVRDMKIKEEDDRPEDERQQQQQRQQQHHQQRQQEQESSGGGSGGLRRIRVGSEEKSRSRAAAPNGSLSPRKKTQSASHTPVKRRSVSPSLSSSLPPGQKASSAELEEVVRGDITLKLEPGKPPRLSRSASQKVVARPPRLFTDEPDRTEEATKTFTVIADCLYASKALGSTEPALECDCVEEWGKFDEIILFFPFLQNTCKNGGAGPNAECCYARSHIKNEQCLRRRVRLHQPCDQNGMHWGLYLR